MKSHICLLPFLFTFCHVFFIICGANAQHHPLVSSKPNAQGSVSSTPGKEPATFIPVLHQPLGDSALQGYSYQATIMEIEPGFVDTVAHRHDADLFVYVLEGTIETQLGGNPPVSYQQGQMFYEKPTITHAFIKNQSATRKARLLLAFIIKQGRQGYIPVVSKE